MATVFNIKDPNPGTWFSFDDNDAESGKIKIRPVTLAKRQEIHKKTIKTKVEYKHNQRFEVQDVNEDLLSEMIWDYVIVEWQGLVDDENKEIVCDPKTKTVLMSNNIGFAQFVNQCLEQVTKDFEDRVGAAEKN
jgi:hypothetical protein